jgi:hypothetical protein
MSENPFSALLSTNFKNQYNMAIDAILANDGLTVPCRINYGSSNIESCNNCIYNPITQRSLNKYNGLGQNPFVDGGICPVCNGYGTIDKAKTETIYLAVLFDSRYWFNWAKDTKDNNAINIADGMIQTICSTTLLPKIKNAQELEVDTGLSNYGYYTYKRAGDPQPCGLGDHRYIITMWSRS